MTRIPPRLPADPWDPVLARQLVFSPDGPTGELPLADELVAFGEGRLLPHEAARVRALVQRSPAARAELLEIYPERYAQIFGVEVEEDVPPGIPKPPRLRAWMVGAASGVALALI